MSILPKPGILFPSPGDRHGLPRGAVIGTVRQGGTAWAFVIGWLVVLAAIPGVSWALDGEAKPAKVGSATSKLKPTTAPSLTPPADGVPLHDQIDRLIEARLARVMPGQAAAAAATDGEFFRRLWLDLAGMIPPAEEAGAFLDDPSPYKRAAMIDRLLESPSYARRMQRVFDVMLMERRPEGYVSAGAWREFLHRAFAENRPYDVLVRQILAADGADANHRPEARFLLDREGDPNILTRDVGRLFLGMDLTCCQCHDHPLIDGYKQQYYHGLYAFFGRTVLLGGKDVNGVVAPGSVAVLGEKADGDVTFTSVFKKKIAHKTGPRVLDAPMVVEKAVAKGQEYLIPPDKDGKVRPVPTASRRVLLGPSLTSPGTPAFARNIANRLWAQVMGRGLVHPVDLHHDDNPPSNPELLDLLTSNFVALKYDVKAFLREILKTRAYQRSSEPPPDSSPELAAPENFAVAPLRPTSPEQMAWSVMQAVGLVAATRRDVEWRLDGADPRMKTILTLDPKRRVLREEVVEEQVQGRLEPNVGAFVNRFGGVSGQPQEAAEATSTVDQALFMTNGDPIKSWLNPAPGWLIGRCQTIAERDATAVAEELYLAVVSRRPTPLERAEAAAYIASRATNLPKGHDPAAERLAALRELAWGLLASTEFRFNH